MRRCSTISVFSLALLGFAVPTVVAAPAPVTHLSSSSAVTSAAVKSLERQIQVRNKVQIDMQNQLNRLHKEIDELRGKVEKNNYDLRKMNERQRELYKEIEELRKKKPTTNTSNVKTPSSNNETVLSGNHAENTQYNAAVDLILQNKDYAGATKAFDAFIKNYPNSIYAPNVHYWLGQLTLTKGDLAVAKKHFTQVTRYNDSNKKAEALLKLGLVATREKDVDTANKFYKQVISEFPNTASATEAQKLLKK